MGMSFKRHFSFIPSPPSVLFMPLCSPISRVFQSPGGPVSERVCARQPPWPTSPDIRCIFFIQSRTRVIGHGQSVWEDIIQSMFVMKCSLWRRTPCVPCRTQRPGGQEVKCLAVPAWLWAFLKARIYSRNLTRSPLNWEVWCENLVKSRFSMINAREVGVQYM